VSRKRSRRPSTKVVRPSGLVKLVDPSADLEAKRKKALDEYIDELLAEQGARMFWCHDLPEELLKEMKEGNDDKSER
jgi:hypothetical protein